VRHSRPSAPPPPDPLAPPPDPVAGKVEEDGCWPDWTSEERSHVLPPGGPSRLGFGARRGRSMGEIVGGRGKMGRSCRIRAFFYTKK